MKQDTVYCITQPEHLPWLGYIHKMISSDVLILLDNVQFKKRHFENRNRIWSCNDPEGFLWLSVPVKIKGRFFQLLKDVEIDNDVNWRRKYLGKIQCTYVKTKYFANYFDDFRKIIEKRYNFLVDLNRELIILAIKIFKIKITLLMASDICSEGKGTSLLLNILKTVDATYYFSGRYGGLDTAMLKDNGINVILQDFHHPVYPQQDSNKFVSNLAFWDLVCNCGEESLKLLYENKVFKLTSV